MKVIGLLRPMQTCIMHHNIHIIGYKRTFSFFPPCLSLLSSLTHTSAERKIYIDTHKKRDKKDREKELADRNILAVDLELRQIFPKLLEYSVSLLSHHSMGINASVEKYADFLGLIMLS